MQLISSDTENKPTEFQIFFINSLLTAELHPENKVSPEEAAFYNAEADGGFAQNTTAWD